MFTPITRRITSVGNSQHIYRFENGYGASVVRGPYTYGGNKGLFELAVIEFDGEDYSLTYSTPITDDVIGHLSDSDVQDYLARISALPAPVKES